MSTLEKIINAGNCQLVLKWDDGQTQILEAAKLQARCPCIRCQDALPAIDPEVKILGYTQKGRFGIQVRFSSGCQRGIYSFEEIRSWLKKSHF